MSATHEDAAADPSATIAGLRRERDMALAREAAIAEILQIINSSPGDPAPVFDAILEKATRLCEAACGQIATYDGAQFRWVAVHGDAPFVAEQLARGPMPPSAGVTWPRIVAGEGVVNIPDLKDTDLYRTGRESARAGADIGGARSLLSVALRKEDVLRGILTVYRQEVRPFTDSEVALLQNFAAQAVIAMENARLLTETREALAQQTATAEVLGVINASPGDLAPVFDALLERAMRLCEAAFGGLWTFDEERYVAMAWRGVPPAYQKFLADATVAPGPGTAPYRLRQGEEIVHNVDLAVEEAYRVGDPQRRALVDLGGARTALQVPLRRDDAMLGVITIYRQEVRPFSDKQVALLLNFAAQAVIAMENARLISETREALEQQTATAEVLQVINSSPGDLAPVFDAMLEKAMRLCEATHGHLFTYDGECFHPAAVHGDPGYVEFTLQVGSVRPSPGVPLGRISRGERIVYIADARQTEIYRTSPRWRRQAEISGVRSLVTVALVKDDILLGAMVVYRQEVRPFSDKQIALLQNFAAQAVIAMENARLVTETREALAQQTATAEVLQVINSSPGDLVPVFDAMLEKAVNLCGASFGLLMKYDGEALQAVAHYHSPPGLVEVLRDPVRPSPGMAAYRILRGEDVVAFVDVAADPAYAAASEVARRLVETSGAHSHLTVALRKDGNLLGQIVVFRQEVRAFTDKQIALLQNFAAQAVIAIENARLLTETREALAQQTATAEVLQVINSSPGELAPVFDAILEKAHTLCGAAHGALHIYDGEFFRPAAMRGLPEPFAERLRQGFRGSGNPLAEPMLAGERFVHVADLAATHASHPGLRVAIELAGIRTLLSVPLRKDGVLLGLIVAFRQEVRPFTDKQIALLENFAAQAVIAMENARLINETREALEQQTATAEVLQVINSSPGDLAPVFDVILEKARAVCGFTQGSLNVYDGEYFRSVVTRGVPEAFAEVLRQPRRSGPQARFLRGDRIVHIPDLAAAEYAADRAGDPVYRAAIELGGIRTVLFVPLRNERALLGYITANRSEVRPFSEKDIALLESFAAQAVIAMENARLLGETREALAQQTATAEVLQVINSSPGDLAPVFDAMLEKAMRLCEATGGALRSYDGNAFHAAAMRGVSSAFAEVTRVVCPDPATGLGRIENGERVVQIVDIADPSDPRAGTRSRRDMVELAGIRTSLWVALRKGETLLGTFVLYRKEVRPFTDKQIALVENFSAQAVIAIENARLLTETREALAQQTATAEVLQVINSSPGDLAPVFDAMLEKAHGLCGAAHGGLLTYDGERFRLAAAHAMPARFAELLRQPFRPLGLQQRLLAGERFVHVHDVPASARNPDDPIPRASDEAGVRTLLMVPLRKDDTLLGYITAHREEVRPFTEKQIALLQNFAAQAVIAMENARLFDELRARTADLQESLEYQTATSDVLKIVSQSGGMLEPVLDNLVETAARICRAESGFIFRLQDGLYRMAASFGIPAEYQDFQARNPIAPDRGTLAGRTAFERRAVHIEDAAADPEYTRVEALQLGNQRTMLGLPLVREDALIGVITLARSHVEPFTEKQIALVATFADQAVIAIENARLFNELRQRTAELGRSVDELRVLNEVAQAVSSTLDLRTVLATTLARSVALAGADSGAVFRYGRAEREFRLVDGFGWSEEFSRKVADLRVGESETAMGEAAAQRVPLQIPDLALRPSAPLRDAALAEGLRGVLIVPLVGPQRIFGAMVLQRREAGEFPVETVRLMQTLASQSVLAIQNARLFREIADKSEQLALASQHKSQFLANMSHELRTPLNAILGYAELLVDGIYGALPEKAQGVLERVQNNGKHLLALINDVLDLAKIEAGQLALTIEDYSLPELVKTVVVATEPLAAAKGLKFTTTIEDGMPRGRGDARRLSQVLLNLVGNAIKFTDAGEVEIRAALESGQFVLSVRDTGPGIADADQERIFGEFQQIDNADTRKKGGTGLGLAISKRMVEMQGGMISVESRLGGGSTFRVVLPVEVEPILEAAAE